MREEWFVRKLDDVAYLAGRIGWKGLTAKEYTKEGPLFLSVHGLNYGDYVDFRDAFHISQERYDESPEIMLQNDDILLCKDGAGIGKLGIIEQLPTPASINSSLLLIRANDGVVPKYLYYALCGPIFQRVAQEKIDGATTPHLYQREIRHLEIPLPSLLVQKRIVTILDEAFEGIGRAAANAENNLANARELFESELNSVFTRKDEGWVNKPLGECFRLRSGDGLTSKRMIAGEYMVYGGNGVAGTHNECNLTGDNVIIGRVGALCGNARHIQESIWLTDNSFKVVDKKYDLDNAFLTYLLNFKGLRGLARQSAQPVISNSSLKDLYLDFPESKPEQRQIVERLDVINRECERLGEIYKRRSSELTELKQSILQKAFSGELTAQPDRAMKDAVA